MLEETKVKQLTPDVAVVHARMACDCPPDGGQARTTIVTFVVHWMMDRWQCASAHSTDVVAGATATS